MDEGEVLQDESGELYIPNCAAQPRARVLKIPRAQETRWTSTYMLLSRVYATRQALLQYAVDARDHYPVDLTPSMFDRIANLVDVLGPATAFNVAIQSDTTPVIQSVLPGLLRLTN